MSAMVAGKGPNPKKEQVSIPTPKHNQALIKVSYAAQNPTDGTSRDGEVGRDSLLNVFLQFNPSTTQLSGPKPFMVSCYHSADGPSFH